MPTPKDSFGPSTGPTDILSSDLAKIDRDKGNSAKLMQDILQWQKDATWKDGVPWQQQAGGAWRSQDIKDFDDEMEKLGFGGGVSVVDNGKGLELRGKDGDLDVVTFDGDKVTENTTNSLGWSLTEIDYQNGLKQIFDPSRPLGTDTPLGPDTLLPNGMAISPEGSIMKVSVDANGFPRMSIVGNVDPAQLKPGPDGAMSFTDNKGVNWTVGADGTVKSTPTQVF
jgi:hypothetical protein